MKNKLLWLFLFFSAWLFFAESAYSNTSQHLITEVKIFDNDTTYKMSYLYDGHKNKVLETKSFLNNDTWVNLSQNEWIYDNGVCVKQYKRAWKLNRWIDVYFVEITSEMDLVTELHAVFDNDNKIEIKKIDSNFIDSILDSRKEYVKSTNQWILNTVTDYSYDYEHVGHDLLSTITTVYNTSDVIKRYKNTFTYNADKTIASQTMQHAAEGADFVNAKLTNWYYKPGTKLVSSQRTKYWDGSVAKWINSEMLTNEYNANNELEKEIYAHWKTMFWENNTSYVYQYDSVGKVAKKQLMLPIYKQWRNTISINYKDLDEDNSQLIESVYGFWGGKTGDLVTSYIPFVFNNDLVIQKAKQLQVTYTFYDNITNPQYHYSDKTETINIFPNPSTGIFYFDTQKYMVTDWSVYDLKGFLVKRANRATKTGVVDLSGLPTGIYVFMGTTADNVLTQKLIRQ